jgi:hypothetical protein
MLKYKPVFQRSPHSPSSQFTWWWRPRSSLKRWFSVQHQHSWSPEKILVHIWSFPTWGNLHNGWTISFIYIYTCVCVEREKQRERSKYWTLLNIEELLNASQFESALYFEFGSFPFPFCHIRYGLNSCSTTPRIPYKFCFHSNVHGFRNKML